MDFVMNLLETYSYAAIFIIFAIGLFGLPIPDEAIILFIGHLTSTGLLNYFSTIIIVMTGVLAGTLFTHLLGKKLGGSLLRKHGKWISLPQKRLHKVERWFDKYGAWTVLIGFFIPGMRHVTCYLSGAIGMKTSQYLLYSSIGVVISCLILLNLGFLFG